MSEGLVERPLAGSSATALARPAVARLPSIDRLRGLVIIVMALDHVRDFFDADAIRFSPTDLTHTYPALFFTRFITHYCAPTFVLLAGISAFLHGARLESRAALSRFLFTRGVWLILLDAFVMSPIWTQQFGAFNLGALWAIGCGMIALAALVFLPPRLVLAIGLCIVAGHNLLDPIHADAFGEWGPFWRLLHEKGGLPFGLKGMVLYPALPWIGVMAVGYGLGPLFTWASGKRDAALYWIGLSAIALFLLLRFSNLYGDPSPWTSQPAPLFTLLSFLNVTKYPPSLLYVLVTLGPALALLPLLERMRDAAGRVLATFGQTPLLFYVLHLYVAFAAAVALSLARGFDPEAIGKFVASGAPPEQFGVGLAGAYAVWIALVAALYPVCHWFAGVKRARREWWLSYL